MVFLKGTYEQCEAYNDLVYQSLFADDIGTTAWDIPVQIESDFYIAKHPDYESELEQVESLPIQEESNDDI